jgi:HAMP domain-containing protein
MSLRGRLVLAFTYVLVLVIVALCVPLALNLSRSVDTEVKNDARSQAQLVAAGTSGRLGNPDQLERLVERSSESLGGRVIVVDSRGRLLADSSGQASRGDDYGTRPEISSALQGRPTQGERHSDLLNEDLLFTAVPVAVNGRAAGAVRITESVDAVKAEQRNDVIALVGVGAVALLLGLVVAWLLAGSLAKPMRGLAATAGRVAHGDLDARASVEGSAEQREVATAFNDMTARMASTLRGQREFVANASHQLRTPLTGLRLRLEAAALKSRDAEVERELTAAEHETERLARLLSELLTLAGGGERPTAQPLDVAGVIDAARASGVRAAGGGGRLRRGPRRDPRQPHRERPQLLAPGKHGHTHLGERRRDGPARGARRGPRPRFRRGRARVPALLPRVGESGRRERHRPRPCRGGGPRRSLGRRGGAHEPAGGRRARRAGPGCGARFTQS